MRPYLAIIYDSFVDAARSRVLWVLLIAWTLVLAAVAPFGIIQGTTLEIQSDQILQRVQLIDDLTAAAKGRGTQAQRAVWKALEPGFQQQIVDRQKNQRGGRLPMGQLASGLTSVLDDVDLYNEEAWPTAAKRSELKELLAKPKDKLASIELQQRNRRLVELAFPGVIRSGEGNVIWIGYGGIKVSDALPLSRKRVEPFFEGAILMVILKFGIGIVGVFVGIIVTSPMIPELFQVGSLHLLLSKPISRSWLLIAKFLGGTAFIAMNVTFLLVGFYLLVGLRLQIWNIGILFCIPIFIFVFMIYYSVSMLAGLIWRNAIISIVITILFWVFCTVIGITHGVMQSIVTVLPQIMRIERVGQSTIVVTNRGGLQIWDAKESKWQTAFGDTFGEESIIGPFWVESEKSLYFGRPIRIPLGGLQSDGIRLQTAKLPELSNNEIASSDALPLWSDKRIDAGPEFPPRTRRAIAWENSIVVFTELGLYRLDIEIAKATDAKTSFSILDLPMLGGKPNAAYVKMTPEDWQPESPMDICYVEEENYFVVYTHGKLIRLDAVGENEFQLGPTLDLELPDGSLALVACNGSVCLVATNKSGLLQVDCETWQKSSKIETLQDCIPRSLVRSPSDGSFALLGRDGKLWGISADGKEAKKPDLSFQGECSAVTIDPSGKWWIAHHVNQIACWDPEKALVLESIVPQWSLVERIYYWGVRPLYWANPKPAAVDSAIQRSLTQDDPLSFGRETTELQIDRGPREDFWQPIWSNAIFIVVMLTIGCWYMHRQDL